jgi:hypothetical protein
VIAKEANVDQVMAEAKPTDKLIRVDRYNTLGSAMKSVPGNAYRLNICNHEMFLSNLVTLTITALLVLGICVSAAAVSVPRFFSRYLCLCRVFILDSYSIRSVNGYER